MKSLLVETSCLCLMICGILSCRSFSVGGVLLLRGLENMKSNFLREPWAQLGTGWAANALKLPRALPSHPCACLLLMILALPQDSERDVRVRQPRCLANDVFVSVGQLRCLHQVCVPTSNLHVENLMLLLLSSHIDMIRPQSNHHIQLVGSLLTL